MAGKSAAMIKFVIGLVVLTPIGAITGFVGIAWVWEWLKGCFFSLAYVCGPDKTLKAGIFLFIAFGSFTAVKNLWDKAK